MEERPMRQRLVSCIAVALSVGLPSVTCLAQAPQPVRAPARTTSVPEADPLRPYASRSVAGFAAERSSRSYSRPKTLPPPPRAYAAVAERGVRDYFPAMRPGTSPNSNTVDPKSLCVAGRRALILRGR